MQIMQAKVGVTGENNCADIAFALDCTGSMGPYINEAKEKILDIVDKIAPKVSCLRLALVEYRDHCDERDSFLTRVHDFTDDKHEMQQWLKKCHDNGGGDTAEAVADALYALRHLNWQSPFKMCFLICDAPPHGAGDSSDKYPHGCPCSMDPKDQAKELGQLKIQLHVIGCGTSINEYEKLFRSLAMETGGVYIPLKHSKHLSKAISSSVEEQLTLESLMPHVHQEVEEVLTEEMPASYSHRELSKKVHMKMAQKGYRVKAVQMNGRDLPPLSSVDEKLTKCTNLKEVREILEEEKNSRSSSWRGTETEEDEDNVYEGVVNEYSLTEKELGEEQVFRMVQQCLNLRSKPKKSE